MSCDLCAIKEMRTRSVRYVVEEGWQRRKSIGAKAAEFSHQVFSQLAVHQRHGQVVFRRGQRLPVVGALQMQLHVWGEKRKALPQSARLSPFTPGALLRNSWIVCICNSQIQLSLTNLLKALQLVKTNTPKAYRLHHRVLTCNFGAFPRTTCLKTNIAGKYIAAIRRNI